MGVRVVHFEMNTPEPEPLVAFYRDLFGWRIAEVQGSGYWIVDTHAGGGINGGIGRDDAAFTTFYVGSPEPEALMERARRAGATVVQPITPTPFVTFGRFRDPDGLIVGIVKAVEDRPATGPSPGGNAPVDWFEIVGADAGRTQAFYTTLFGWDIDRSGDTSYTVVEHEHDEDGNDLGIGGGIGGGETPWVTVYANVPDLEASLARAESLGASRVYGPMDVGGFLRTAAIRDPAGNPFGMYARTGS